MGSNSKRGRGRFDVHWNPTSMDILLNKCGAFYETYDESAERLSSAMAIKLYSRGTNNRLVAGFPVSALNRYLDDLDGQGLRVFVIDNADQEPWSRAGTQSVSSPPAAVRPVTASTARAQLRPEIFQGIVRSSANSPSTSESSERFSRLHKEVLAAAMLELKALVGQAKVSEIGNAKAVDPSNPKRFRVASPSRDLGELPPGELFLATDKNSEQRIKVDEVILATKSEVIVEVGYASRYPSSLVLYYLTDPTIVWKALVSHLEEFERPGLSKILLDSGPLSSGVAHRWDGLNAAQQTALGAMVADGVSLVWGPPGTGKTRVIGAAVTSLVKEGKTVALVSNTNVAVDQALLQVCKDIDDLQPGMMLRLGYPSLSGVTNHPFLMADKAARIIGKELNAELTKLTAELRVAMGADDSEYAKALESAIDDLGAKSIEELLDREVKRASIPQIQEQFDYFTKNLKELGLRVSERGHIYDHARDALSSFEEHEAILELEREVASHAETIRAFERALSDLAKRTEAAKQKPIFTRRKLLKDLKLEHSSLESQLIETRSLQEAKKATIAEAGKRDIRSSDLVKAREKMRETQASWEKSKKAFEDCKTQIHGAAQLLESLFALPEPTPEETQLIELVALNSSPEAKDPRALLVSFQRRVEQLEASRRERKIDIARLTEQIEAIQRALAGLEERLIAEAPVIGTTLAQLFVNRALTNRYFDVIIIDEVSAATLPMVYGALTKARDGAVLVGDFEQNGPIANSLRLDAPAEVERWLTEHAFAQFGIDGFASAIRTHGCEILTEQYRFGPATTHLANAIAYGGLLTVGQRLRGPADGPEITLIDTSKVGEVARISEGQGGRGRWWPVGPAIAQAIVDLHRNENIGVVTPYRDQARMTKAWLADQGATGALVGTAHSFQGQEFSTVLVDLVEDGSGSSWVAKANRQGGSFNLGGVRLFNVAVTRNAGRLYILGNASTVSAARNGPLLEVGNMVRSGTIEVVDARSLLGIEIAETGVFDEGSLPDLTGVKELPSFTVLNDVEFYEAFESDLQRAKSTVQIWSPFVTPNRLATLVPRLMAQINRGVKVQALTKARAELQFPDLLGDLRSAGIQVTEKQGMHQKVVVIDRSITYLGSLNVLSNNGQTGEAMWRFEGADFSRQAIQGLPEFPRR